MAKVSDRMRLIRQGDNRELAVLEAAVKKVCSPDKQSRRGRCTAHMKRVVYLYILRSSYTCVRFISQITNKSTRYGEPP